MIPLTMGEVQRWTGGTLAGCAPDQVVQGLTIDSREVQPGFLFVALPGTRTDGHRYVEEVWQKGGLAMVRRDCSRDGGPQIVVDDPLDALGQMLSAAIERDRVTVVGVTGSVGKTSVKELTAQALSARYRVHASWGNYNTAIGLPLSYFRARPNITHFVAEMGMSALGEIRQMTRMAPPTVSIITAIGPSHLQRLGSMQAIQQAKGEILEGVKPDGVVILNADNRWTRELGERHRKTPVRWFGTGPDADARLWTSELVAEGTRIAVEVQGQKVTLTLPWLGTHHGLNVACALLTAQVLGVPVAEAARALERIDPQRSRIRVSHWHGVTVLEDVYNASPASMVAALEVLARQPGRKIAVLGDMLELGSCEQAGHQLVGEKAAQVADWIVGVGPRARWMVEAAQQQGHAQTVACANHDQALRWLQAMLADGDVVLFKASRSMALERLVEQLTVGRTRS